MIASRTPNPLCHQAASKLHLPRINLRWVRSFPSSSSCTCNKHWRRPACIPAAQRATAHRPHQATTTKEATCSVGWPNQINLADVASQYSAAWFIVGVREKNDRPPESESDHQQSCPCTPRNPPHLAAAAPASLPTQAQLDKIPSVEIEVRPTALPSLLTLTLTPDLDFQSLASEGRDPYAGRTEGHGSVGSKVIVETDGRTRPISLPYLPR